MPNKMVFTLEFATVASIFILWFNSVVSLNFVFLFFSMATIDNELETKKNKIEPQHT